MISIFFFLVFWFFVIWLGLRFLLLLLTELQQWLKKKIPEQNYENDPNFIMKVIIECQYTNLWDIHYVVFIDEQITLTRYCDEYYMWNSLLGTPINKQGYQKNKRLLEAHVSKVQKHIEKTYSIEADNII